MKIIPFSPPDISSEEINEVVETLKSGWITTGAKVKELEKKIADFCNVSNCVCLNSQTACAELALRILGIGPGDEVIVPAYTYTASCSVIIHVGATPILIDSQKDCVEMDYELVEKAITNKTKAIIPVDIGGVPCDYDRLFEIVNSKKNLFKPTNNIQKLIGRVAVLADTAHSLGSSFKGKATGSIADFSAFSFHAVKNVTTAEGGALTWNDFPGIDSKEIYKQIQLLSLHGQSKDALSKTKLGSWEYDVIGPWYKCNMTDVLASIGLAQLRRYKTLLERRKEIVDRYDSGIKELNVTPATHFTSLKESSYHLYMVRLNDFSLEKRNKFIELMAERGVACNVHYKPLPMFTAYKNLGFDISNYPNAYNLYKNEITLPLHTLLSDSDVDYVIKAFKESYYILEQK